MKITPVNFPIGLGTIASVLLNEGHEVNVLDINARRLSPTETIQSLDLNDKYDAIGIGGLITTYKFIKYLIPEIKKRNPRMPGPDYSYTLVLRLQQKCFPVYQLGVFKH